MKKFNLSFTMLFFFFCCCPVTGNAQNNAGTQYLSQGIDLFKSGHYQKAYDALIEAFETSPENLELNFYLGRAAFETGNYEMAVMVFERILIFSPLEHRVKLEIARAFHRLGANDIARQYCREVLATNPPDAVKDNIQKFLMAMDKSEQTSFLNGQIIVGVDWSNNVWASPSIGTVKTIIGDIDLTGPSSIKTQDWVYNATLDIEHTYKFPYSDYAWKTKAIAYKAIYDNTHDLDLRYIGGYTGPEFVFGKNRVGVGFLLNRIELGSTEYMNSVGGKAQLNHAVNPALLFNAMFKYEIKDFPGNSEKDSKNQSVSLDTAFSFKKTWYGLGLTAENEDADNDENSYNRYISSISVTRELPFNLSASINYAYQYSHYDDPAALFSKRRKDHQHTAGSSLRKKIWQSPTSNQSIFVSINYQHTWAYSNIDLYEYNLDLLQLSLIYTF